MNIDARRQQLIKVMLSLPGVNAELVAQEPDRFFIPSYTGKRGWLGMRLDLDIVDWD